MGGVKCKRCEGEGKYTDYEDTCFAAYFKRCERCGGTGYVEGAGETISYSSGKVPEGDSQVASLVREAREIAEEELAFVKDYPTEDRIIVSRRATYKRQLALCDALEEREREVERLRQVLVKRERKIASLDRGILRLWGLVNGVEAPAAREREERP